MKEHTTDWNSNEVDVYMVKSGGCEQLPNKNKEKKKNVNSKKN